MWKYGTYFVPFSGDFNNSRNDTAEVESVLQRTLHGARGETLRFVMTDGTGFAGGTISLNQFEQLVLAVGVPKGEVWIVDYIRAYIVFGANITCEFKLSEFSPILRAEVKTATGNQWRIEKTGAGLTELQRFEREVGQTLALGPATTLNKYWKRRLADSLTTDEGLFTDLWLPGNQYNFIVESQTAGPIAIANADGLTVTMRITRVPLGETLLSALRNKATSDAEIQRVLQATAAAGIPQAPISIRA